MEGWQLLGIWEKPAKSPLKNAALSDFKDLNLTDSMPCSHTTHTRTHAQAPPPRPLPPSTPLGPRRGLSCLPVQLVPGADEQLSNPPVFPPGSTFLTSSPGTAETPPYFLPHLSAEEEGNEAPAARHQRELLTAFQTVGSEEERARPVPNHHTSYALN